MNAIVDILLCREYPSAMNRNVLPLVLLCNGLLGLVLMDRAG